MICLDYQSLKDYFSKTTKWKLNILVSMCFWKIDLYCKLHFIFRNQFNQKLCNIMHKKLGYALWLKIACPGQITHTIMHKWGRSVITEVITFECHRKKLWRVGEARKIHYSIFFWSFLFGITTSDCSFGIFKYFFAKSKFIFQVHVFDPTN